MLLNLHSTFTNISPFPCKIFFKKIYLFKFSNFTFLKKTNTGEIQVNTSFDPPSSGLAHSTPVFKSIAYQGMCWNGGNCLVPVLNFHRSKCNIDDISIPFPIIFSLLGALVTWGWLAVVYTQAGSPFGTAFAPVDLTEVSLAESHGAQDVRTNR